MLPTKLVWTTILNCINFMYCFFIEFICYDDACHLRKYSRNPVRASLTQQAEAISHTEMVVDKMHMRGHIDPWCKANCDPHKFDTLRKV